MTESVISGIKKMAIGAVLMEYGALECIDNTKHELKFRVRKCLNASQEVQNYFKSHPNATAKARGDFKDNFNNSEVVLLSEIFNCLYDLCEEDLEIVLESLKANIDSKQIINP